MQTSNNYLQNKQNNAKIRDMNREFLNQSIDCEQLINNPNGQAEKYVLKNNEASIKKIHAFFTSDKNILLVNGFAGTGKKQITETFLANANPETHICRFVCSPSSTINDLYLQLSNYFKPKFSGNDFNLLTSYKDKVQYALARIESNIILAFYNFDLIKEENTTEFLNYINALTDLKNVKTIIVSRTFDSNNITDQNNYSKVMVKALSKELFESYFKDFDINVSNAKFEQLYRLTRGYYLYCTLTLRILINQGISLDEFLNQYFASGLSYDKYIAAAYSKLIIGTTKNAFNLFIQLRHGLNEKALVEIGAFPDNVLKTLSENCFIYKVDDMYYPSNFLKEQLKDDVKDVVYKSKLVKYYTAQSEKSPDERDFVISRESLINEISYFTETDITVKVEKEKQEQPKIEPTVEVQQEVKKENEEIINLTPEELLSKTKEALDKYDYIQALKYLSAILMNQSAYENRELINDSYYLLVTAYSKLSKWEYALYYLNLLEEYFRENNKQTELQNILYERANILYKQNKIIDSINILKRIIANTTDREIIVKSNLLLANISLLANNSLLGLNYIKTSLANITEKTDVSIVSELYFQFAFLSDEFKNEETAIEYYKKCIELNCEPNKYTALSYSNLGEIYSDKELQEEAKKNFEKASELEKSLGNDYGVYYTLSKIVELTPREEKEIRLKLMNDARGFAINSRDNDSIISSTIALGDMYYDYSMPQDALIEYFNLYTQGKDIMEPENLEKLKSRIQDIKARLGKEEFEKLAPNYN